MEAAGNLKETPHHNSNQERSQQAKTRLQQIIESLKALGNLASKPIQRLKQIINQAKTQLGIGISARTLWKDDYQPLWHPRYDDLHDNNNNKTTNTLPADSPPEITAEIAATAITPTTGILHQEPRQEEQSRQDHTPPAVVQEAQKQPDPLLIKQQPLENPRQDHTPLMKVFCPVSSTEESEEEESGSPNSLEVQTPELISRERSLEINIPEKQTQENALLENQIPELKAEVFPIQQRLELLNDKLRLSNLCGDSIFSSNKENLSIASPITEAPTQIVLPPLKPSLMGAIGQWLCQTCIDIRDRLYAVRERAKQRNTPIHPPHSNNPRLNEFLAWYSRVPKSETGILDVPYEHLPTDGYNEPLVRIGEPDLWLRIPFTLMPWRKAAQAYPSEEIGFDIPVIYIGEERTIEVLTGDTLPRSYHLSKGVRTILLPRPHSDPTMVYVRLVTAMEDELMIVSIDIALLETCRDP
jgi:hypothetical protein